MFIRFFKKNFFLENNFFLKFSILTIVLFFFVAIFSYIIIPDNSVNANSVNVEIQSMKPGFKSKLLLIPNLEYKKKITDNLFGSRHIIRSYAIVDYRFEDDKIIYQKYNNNENDVLEESINIRNFVGYEHRDNIHNNVREMQNLIVDKYIINRTFYFGTDIYGRCLFSRVILGSRVSISIGFIAVFISFFIGVFLGSFAGYFGGVFDNIVMYIINVFWSIPTLLLVIAITLILGKGFWQVYVAIGLSVWVDVARIVRGKVKSEVNKNYVHSSRLFGFNHLVIIFNQIIPNILPSILIICASNFASSILLESGLSFLGIGSQPPTPSWGYMIKENYQYLILGNAYLVLIPALFLTLLVSSFIFISNHYSSKVL